MKKIFLVLFSFLFIGTVLTGSCFLLSGCDQSYSQNENSENNENYNDNNTDEDEEIEASGYYFHAYLISFDEQNPSGANNTNGGSVIVSGPGAFGLWADSPHGKNTAHAWNGAEKDQGDAICNIKDGYDFIGWFTDSTCTGTNYVNSFKDNHSYDNDASDGRVQTGRITLTSTLANIYAKVAKPVTVTFKVKDGGGTVNQSSVDGHYGDSVSVTTSANSGYQFISWKYRSNDTYYDLTSDSTYKLLGYGGYTNVYADFDPISYKITYNENGGNNISDITYNIESSSSLPTPTRTGYTFDGWKPSSNVGNWESSAVYKAGMSLKGKYGDVTLVAQWTPTNYTITYNGNGATSPGALSYNITSTSKLANLTRNGYTFNGWKPSSNVGNWSSGSTYAPNTSVNGKYGNVELVAQWTPINYTITYNGNGATSPSSLSYNITSTSKLPTITRNGYTLNGWKPSSNVGNWSSDSTYAPNTSVTGKYGNVTLVAQWIADSFKIVYNGNGGTTPSETAYTTESNILLPTSTRNGYTFKGWKPSSNVGNWSSSSTYAPNTSVKGKYGSVTLVAQWTINSYTITFNTNGGLSVSAISYQITSSTLLPSTTRNGYTFKGWKPSSNVGNWSSSSTYASNTSVNGKYGSVVLVAQWEPIQYTITFNYNGGSGSITSLNYNITSTSSLPVPIYTGHTFNGWKPTSSVGNWISSSTYTGSLTGKYGSVTLVAQWKANSYKVVFDINTGNPNASGNMSSVTYEYDKSYTLPKITFKNPGYEFQGWSTTRTGSVQFSNEDTIINLTSENGKEITLYAIWKANVIAKYDEEGDYWYVEMGSMPQTKLTDQGIIDELENDDIYNDLDGITMSPKTYFFAGMMLSAKVYHGEEYCKVLGNWYRVEPVRWRLKNNPNYDNYYGNTEDTLVVQDHIVTVGKYSKFHLYEGNGYISANTSGYSAVNDHLNNFLKEEQDFLVEFSAISEKFTTSGKTTEESENEIFLSSKEEIAEIMGKEDYSAEFSDLVKDYLSYFDSTYFYYVRDLGTNLNNVICYNSSGGVGQRFPTMMLGLRLTIKVSEFVCLK